MTLATLYEQEKKKYLPIKTWRVPSSHRQPDPSETIYYTIELWGDGKMYCGCVAGSFRRKCKHLAQKQDELSEEFGGIFQAIEFYRNKIK